jgi:hypothetical protein
MENSPDAWDRSAILRRINEGFSAPSSTLETAAWFRHEKSGAPCGTPD